MPNPLEFYTRFMLDFVQEAGAYALAGQKTITRTMKADQSVVTEIDMAISKMFADKIAALPDAADHFLIDEEFIAPLHSVRDQLQKSKYVWVLDPIDGTSPFANQMPLWGILISLFIDGAPTLAAVYLPKLRELIYTDGTACYFVEENSAPQKLEKLPPAPLPAESTIMADWIEDYDYTSYRMMSVRCSAVFTNFALLGRARAVFYAPPAKIWDAAAAAVLAPHLGLEMRGVTSGKIFEKFDLAHVMDDWALSEKYLLCQPGHFEPLRTLPRA